MQTLDFVEKPSSGWASMIPRALTAGIQMSSLSKVYSELPISWSLHVPLIAVILSQERTLLYLSRNSRCECDPSGRPCIASIILLVAS